MLNTGYYKGILKQRDLDDLDVSSLLIHFVG